MGKEGDLWDDSALIRAFDDAVSKYKVMHGLKNSEFNDEAPTRDAGESGNAKSSFNQEMPDDEHLLPVNENHPAASKAPEPVVTSSNVQDLQQEGKRYSYSEVAGDYNQLLNQYYELEEKRQKILQQLNQCSASDYQFSGEGCSSFAQWPTWSQGHSAPVNQDSHPLVACSCCSYGCQPLALACSPCPACSSCSIQEASVSKKPTHEPGPATAPVNANSTSDSDMLKIAMGAAAKALSSIDEGKHKEGKTDEEVALNTSLPTDLGTVLNAWYSAGFYTGKYLMEQSMAKKRH